MPAASLFSAALVCATAPLMKAHVSTNTPEIHAPNPRIIFIFILSTASLLDMLRIVEMRQGSLNMFLTNRVGSGTNWTAANTSAVRHYGRPLGQKLEELMGAHGRMKR
jgi:hypothetical protein